MFDHITDAIKTPALIRLSTNLYVARFETMKVYSTLVAVERLLKRGVINQNTTLLDSSSGIYAYALALACHKFGLKCYIIASKTVDATLKVQLHILGANVEQVEPAPTLKLDQSLRVARIKEILQTHDNIHWMQQYHDDIHYAGYEPIADLIKQSVGVNQLSIIGGIGSGCSTGGIVQSLRHQNEHVELIGVQPFGSVTFGSEHIEDPGIIIAGIGTSIPFRNVKHSLYDHIHWVSFEYGCSGAIALLRNHAIFAGLSSGCCYLVAVREAALRPYQTIIFIAPDTGHRYAESVFARYQETKDIRSLAPTPIASPKELTLPWSVMHWSRQQEVFPKLLTP